MTACLHYTPGREKAVNDLAREIGRLVRAHRERTGLSRPAYGRRYGFHKARLHEVEFARKPNFTILTALKLLELAGYELRIVPKGTSDYSTESL